LSVKNWVGLWETKTKTKIPFPNDFLYKLNFTPSFLTLYLFLQFLSLHVHLLQSGVPHGLQCGQPLPRWSAMGFRGTTCITMVCTTGCWAVFPWVPAAPPPSPSSLVLVSAGLFLTLIFLTPHWSVRCPALFKICYLELSNPWLRGSAVLSCVLQWVCWSRLKSALWHRAAPASPHRGCPCSSLLPTPVHLHPVQNTR